jgi:DNA (cytosine-5)-methyltransferase 1
MLNYYNEYGSYPAAWLRRLFPGADVDDRDIRDVGIGDISTYDRVHLFAGIGGWEYALQLAGWSDTEPIWTGSCPCQPFSQCGKGEGSADKRHLWPEMFRLIKGNQPPVIFGEQVAGPLGVEWFDGVRSDLESIGYSCGMAVLPAACVGSPHRRNRIFWVADSAWPTRVRTVRRRDSGVDHRVFAEEWGDYRPVECRDGKIRRVGVGIQPLAPRVPGEVDRILAYGNSIVPQVAAAFIQAYMATSFQLDADISDNISLPPAPEVLR